MNCDIIWCMVILIKLCTIGAIGYRLWLSSFSSTIFIPFLPVLQDPNYESLITFWTFVIILQVMIPLSLYVTIEMAKVGQIYHIGRDNFLYDKETGRRAECRALNITEELGQVIIRMISKIILRNRWVGINFLIPFVVPRYSTYSRTRQEH